MIRRLLRSESGAGLAEFAIAVPFLVFMVLGLVETGRYAAFAVRLSNAAHAGVQFAAQGYTTLNPPDIASAACGDSGFSCTTSTPKPGHTASPDTMFVSSTSFCSAKISKGSPCPPGSEYVQVNTSGTFKALLNYPVFGESVPMSAQATQQVNP